jgi:hypothetical protein
VAMNRLKTRRSYVTFGVLTWVFAMLVGVLGVGLALHESLGAFVFTGCLLPLAILFWLWIFRPFTR